MATLRSLPYISWVNPGFCGPDGPPRMGGMFAEVFHAVRDIMNFTYELDVPPDGQWGANMGNGSWSGMVGMLQREEIDIGNPIGRASLARFRIFNSF